MGAGLLQSGRDTVLPWQRTGRVSMWLRRPDQLLHLHRRHCCDGRCVHDQRREYLRVLRRRSRDHWNRLHSDRDGSSWLYLLKTEAECIASKDGRVSSSGSYGGTTLYSYSYSPCRWCCGQACTLSNSNKCEPAQWLGTQSTYIGHSRDGIGYDNCNGASTNNPPPTSSYCPSSYPIIEKHSSSSHGDVCRKVSNNNWTCPGKCVRLGEKPWCVKRGSASNSVTGIHPCRPPYNGYYTSSTCASNCNSGPNCSSITSKSTCRNTSGCKYTVTGSVYGSEYGKCGNA